MFYPDTYPNETPEVLLAATGELILAAIEFIYDII